MGAKIKVETTTITIAVDTNIDMELERLAKATGHSKPDVVRDVLAEWLQDQEDYRDAVSTASRNETSSSSADVRRRLSI